MKNKLRPYFSFTKKERTGIVLLGFTCLLFIFLPYFFPKKELEVSDITLLTGLQKLEENSKSISGKSALLSSEMKQELFLFNPNILDVAGWMRLGLHEKLAQRIINYRNKGGHFYKPSDIKKIWGMSSEKAEELIPFVLLPDTEIKKLPARNPVVIIDINTADLDAWKTLPGIGETLSSRIIKYRSQSGGFARIEELQQVFGLTDSSFLIIKPFLRLNDATIPKLLLNRASAHQIVQKTGIHPNLAQSVVKRRLEKGSYNAWAELEELPGMTNDILSLLQRAFQLE